MSRPALALAAVRRSPLAALLALPTAAALLAACNEGNAAPTAPGGAANAAVVASAPAQPSAASAPSEGASAPVSASKTPSTGGASTAWAPRAYGRINNVGLVAGRSVGVLSVTFPKTGTVCLTLANVAESSPVALVTPLNGMVNMFSMPASLVGCPAGAQLAYMMQKINADGSLTPANIPIDFFVP